jgi:hypothetical protein
MAQKQQYPEEKQPVKAHAVLSSGFQVRDTETFWQDPLIQQAKRLIEERHGFFQEDATTGLIAFGYSGPDSTLIFPRPETEDSPDSEEYEEDGEADTECFALDRILSRHLVPDILVRICLTSMNALEILQVILVFVSVEGTATLDTSVWPDQLVQPANLRPDLVCFLKSLRNMGV